MSNFCRLWVNFCEHGFEAENVSIYVSWLYPKRQVFYRTTCTWIFALWIFVDWACQEVWTLPLLEGIAFTWACVPFLTWTKPFYLRVSTWGRIFTWGCRLFFTLGGRAFFDSLMVPYPPATLLPSHELLVSSLAVRSLHLQQAFSNSWPLPLTLVCPFLLLLLWDSFL